MRHLVLLGGLLLTASPGLAAAGQYEMKFQFDQNGTPSMHTFILKWAGPTTTLQSIDVLVSDTQEVIQTIAVPQDQVKLVWKDLQNSRPNETRDKFLETLDYNFDKYADLRLTREWPYKVGNKFYLVYLFDETANQYVINEEISALPGPVPNNKERRIESTVLGDLAGHEWVKRAYSINPAGRLKVQTRITQTASDKSRLTFHRDVRIRIEGELQRVCKLVVPAEGKVVRKWGRKRQCERFLTKD